MIFILVLQEVQIAANSNSINYKCWWWPMIPLLLLLTTLSLYPLWGKLTDCRIRHDRPIWVETWPSPSQRMFVQIYCLNNPSLWILWKKYFKKTHADFLIFFKFNVCRFKKNNFKNSTFRYYLEKEIFLKNSKCFDSLKNIYIFFKVAHLWNF